MSYITLSDTFKGLKNPNSKWTRGMNRLRTLANILGGDRKTRDAGLAKLKNWPNEKYTTGPSTIKTRQLVDAKRKPVTTGRGYTSKGPGIQTASLTYTKVPSGANRGSGNRGGSGAKRPDYSKDIARYSKSGYHIYKKGSRAATDWRAAKAAAKGKNFMFNKDLYRS